MERKSFTLHEIKIFLIGQITPRANLFYLEKTVSAATKKQCFVLRQASPLQTALPLSPCSNSRCTTERLCNLIKLCKADAYMTCKVQSQNLGLALQDNGSFWMKYQPPPSSGMLLIQKHKM